MALGKNSIDSMVNGHVNEDQSYGMEEKIAILCDFTFKKY